MLDRITAQEASSASAMSGEEEGMTVKYCLNRGCAQKMSVVLV